MDNKCFNEKIFKNAFCLLCALLSRKTDTHNMKKKNFSLISKVEINESVVLFVLVVRSQIGRWNSPGEKFCIAQAIYGQIKKCVVLCHVPIWPIICFNKFKKKAPILSLLLHRDLRRSQCFGIVANASRNLMRIVVSILKIYS